MTESANSHPDVTQSQLSTAADKDVYTSSENGETDVGSGRFQTGYGCLRCRPGCLQFLASARWFLVFVCMGTFIESMVVNGLLGVNISTIERRFALSSSQTAWISASYEISGVPVLLIIGYLGLALHRPVWIGGGLVTLGIGFVIYSIPHFAAPLYRYADTGESSNLCVKTVWNGSNNASSPNNERYSLHVVLDRPLTER